MFDNHSIGISIQRLRQKGRHTFQHPRVSTTKLKQNMPSAARSLQNKYSNIGRSHYHKDAESIVQSNNDAILWLPSFDKHVFLCTHWQSELSHLPISVQQKGRTSRCADLGTSHSSFSSTGTCRTFLMVPTSCKYCCIFSKLTVYLHWSMIMSTLSLPEYAS